MRQRIAHDLQRNIGGAATAIVARQIGFDAPVGLVRHAPPARGAVAEFAGRAELAIDQAALELPRQARALATAIWPTVACADHAIASAVNDGMGGQFARAARWLRENQARSAG